MTEQDMRNDIAALVDAYRKLEKMRRYAGETGFDKKQLHALETTCEAYVVKLATQCLVDFHRIADALALGRQ